ncbi:GK [Cordylochernes scorpioides]|uniref:glycerol kinase n=1 Tax=Cordylochernes scorpioides TaxID=51811 RepID=A0ABY6KPK9_9ARAC|nr:GK [Cordylochernes scorpioides]
MLTVAYGEATLDRSNVYRWYKIFSEGREDVNDEERAGRPSTSTKDEKFNEVEKMILANRRITVREVAEDLNISIGSCHSIFINDLGMRRVAAKFVPKLLNCDQKQHRMNIANEMLDSVRDDPNLLQRVITGDEAGVVHHEFLPQGRTVNKEYYLQVMRNLREAIRQKRPDLWKNKNWLLHNDNAPAHTSLLVRDFLAKNNTLMIPQPPYSPDLAPCDFFLFPKLKRPMKGRRYATLDEIKTASKEELKKILKNDFLKCFEDWKNPHEDREAASRKEQQTPKKKGVSFHKEVLVLPFDKNEVPKVLQKTPRQKMREDCLFISGKEFPETRPPVQTPEGFFPSAHFYHNWIVSFAIKKLEAIKEEKEREEMVRLEKKSSVRTLRRQKKERIEAELKQLELLAPLNIYRKWILETPSPEEEDRRRDQGDETHDSFSMSAMEDPLIAAIDQGTSSSRFFVFSAKTMEVVAKHQVEIHQTFPKDGWVEEDPLEILSSIQTCIRHTIDDLQVKNYQVSNIKAVGITNQRESTIIWNSKTGQPFCNAVIWLDNRTVQTVENLIDSTPDKNKEFLKSKCGLPFSPYFSAVKIRWLLDNHPELRDLFQSGEFIFGTVDSWLIWNLTGGTERRHSHHRCHQRQQDDAHEPPDIIVGPRVMQLLQGSPQHPPRHQKLVRSDQSAALLGHSCLEPGQAKNTYGTGCFILYNTGREPVESKHGLLTTVGYKLGPDAPTIYALEGSVAVAGAAIKWLRDSLGIIKSTSEVESLAASVDSSHNVIFVPAFSGLYAPHWDPHARGTICGLTQFSTRNHIVRATLEAISYQTKEIINAMNLDSGTNLTRLNVDGGMSVNHLFLQIQADILGIPIVKPQFQEATALGAAIAAGSAVKLLDMNDLQRPSIPGRPPRSTLSTRSGKWPLKGAKAEIERLFHSFIIHIYKTFIYN